MIEVVLAEGLERVRGYSRVGVGVEVGPGERGQTRLNRRGGGGRGRDFQQL